MKATLTNEFWRFLVVGIASTIVNYGLFHVTLAYFDFHYLASSAIGYLSGVLFGFYFNKSWSFTIRHELRFALPKYLVVYLFSLVVSVGLLKIMVDYFLFGKYASNLVAITVTTVLNFVGIKFYAFNK